VAPQGDGLGHHGVEHGLLLASGSEPILAGDTFDTMRWLAVIPGVAIVVGSAFSVLRSLVVPRANRNVLLSVVGGKIVAPTVSFLALRRRAWRDQEQILAYGGPVALLLLFGLWMVGFYLGFALMLWPVDHVTLATAIRESGSSMFTLGTTASGRPLATAIDYAAAATGLLVVALEIAYVPTLYAAFNRREVQVTLLQARAGLPSWGPELLARHQTTGMLDRVGDLYGNWEAWTADVAESHTNYPVLLFFRSPHPLRSWVLAMLAVLDSAALYLSLSPQEAPIEGRLVLRIGFESLRQIATVLEIPHDPDPRPTDPVMLTQDEYRAGIERLEQAGFPMECSAAEAWPHFAAWRVNYEAIAYALARGLNAAPAPWSGPRRDGIGVVDPPALVNRTPDDPEGTGATRFRI